MDLYNWYENSFPNDFKQLVKIKHYNISNVSFLLSNVWYKLEYGEKLLMCAVYYDDFNLVKQLINEKILFRVNPFLSKNYFVQKPNQPNLNSYNSIDILYDDFNPAIRHNSVTSERRNSQSIDHRLCICHNAIRLRMLSTNVDSTNSTDRRYSVSSLGPNEPTYFFNQIVHEPNLQSPFYLAVKLNKLNMCELFLDFFKSMFTKHRYSSQNQPTIYMNQSNFLSFNKNNKYFRPLKACCLNAVISDSELGKLILITLINRNYDIAKLILSNIYNPKKLFNFKPCSESFITHDDFCLFLVKNDIVDLKIMLKEAVYRHAATTVITIINHAEQSYEFKKSKKPLIELLNLIITYAVSVGDFKIFYNMLSKLITHVQLNEMYIASQFNLTVEKILELSVLRKAKRSEQSTPALLNQINMKTLEENAKLKEFDLKGYFDMPKLNVSSKKCLLTSSLSLANRIKLLNLIHNNTDSREFKLPWMQFESELKQKLTNYERLFDPIDRTRRIHCCHYVNILESQAFIIKFLRDKLEKSFVITNKELIMTAKDAHSELSLYYLIDELEFGNKQNDKLLEPIDDIHGNFLEILFCRMVMCSKPEQEVRMRKLFFEAIILKNARMTCTTNLVNLFCSDSEYVQNKLMNIYFPCLFYLSSSFQIFYSDLCFNRFNYLMNWYLRNYFFDKDELRSAPYLSDDLKRKQVMFGYLAHKRKEEQQLEETFVSNSSSSISISSLSANLEDEIMSDQSIVADPLLSSDANSTVSPFPVNPNTSIYSDTSSTSTTSTATTVIFNGNFNNNQTACANRRKLELTLKDLSRTSFMSLYLNNSQAYSQFVNAINDSFRHYIFCFNEIYNLFDDYQFP